MKTWTEADKLIKSNSLETVGLLFYFTLDTGNRTMNEELKRKYLRRTAVYIAITIAAAVLISGIFITLKIIELDKTKQNFEEVNSRKYSIDMDVLSFLKDSEKKRYKKKLIEVCDAYDLKKMNEIVIDEKSLDDNKEASMWEWNIYCDDTKHTSFRCGFKKSTKEFSIERDYSSEKTISNVKSENKTKENAETARSFDVTENDPTKVCKIGELKLPENKLLDTDKEKKAFTEGLEAYLAYIGVSEVRTIEFDAYNEYGNKKHINECIFNLKGAKSKKYTKLSAVYRNKTWEYAVIY